MDYTNDWIERHNRTERLVGITTRCSEDNIQWLKDFLTQTFQDLILGVDYLLITNTNRFKWEDKVDQYSAVILYHTKHQGCINISNVEGGIYDEELSYLCHKLGREKVLVVLDDMEDTSDEERQRILETQPGLTQLSSHLILVPEIGKYSAASSKRQAFLTFLGAERTPSCADENIQGRSSFRTKSDDSTICNDGILTSFVTKRAAKKHNLYQENSRSSKSKYRVGIFSRSEDDNYRWLVRSLEAANTRTSLDVHSIYISSNYQLFFSEISWCNFAILYHTMKQGRLNITDVSNSLYDQELKELSECLGKKYVVVVVDDIMDTSKEEKERILEQQPSISSLAEDLFLFSEQHKDPKTLQTIVTLIQKNGSVISEICNMSSNPPYTLYKELLKKDEQRQQLSVKTWNGSDWGEENSAPNHFGGSTQYKPSGPIHETTSPNMDSDHFRKRQNYSLLGQEYESSLKSKNNFEEQDSKKIMLGATSADENVLDRSSSRTKPDDYKISNIGISKHDEEDFCSSQSKYRVGIFSRSVEDNYRWLVRSLEAANTRRSLDVHSIYISNNYQLFFSEMSQCNFAILYHTMKQGRLNITDVTDSLYDQELRELSACLGKKYVVVVVDDMMDTSKEEKEQILKWQPSICSLAEDLFLFSDQHKDPKTLQTILTLIQKNGSVINEICKSSNPPYALYKELLKKDEQHVLDRSSSRTKPDDYKIRVGIFSRSADDNYRWLVRSLQAANMRGPLDVHSVYISSSYQPFFSEMSWCNFAILYHTKKHGRLNITNVTDSLYDQELRELSECLGKKHVIVVVDDMMDTSNEEKERILENQPIISSLAEDLFLFGEQHKDPKTFQKIMKLIQKSVFGHEDLTMKYNPRSPGRAQDEDKWYQPSPQKISSGDEADFNQCHLKRTTSYKPTESIWELTPTALDIYTSQKHHDYPLHGHDHESSSSKKIKFEVQDSKTPEDANRVDGDSTYTVSWLDDHLRVLNDTGSAFSEALRKFIDAWPIFKQANENPPNEKDVIISNQRRNIEEKEEEVSRLKIKLQDQQRLIEEQDKVIQHSDNSTICRCSYVDNLVEGGRHNLQHPAENLEEIKQEKDKLISQLHDEMKKLQKKLQDQEKTSRLPLGKRRGAKKWPSENMNDDPEGSLGEVLKGEPETMENHSILEDLEHLDDRHKMDRLWHRITELESRVKQLTYTTDLQKHELEKYQQRVKEQSSQINNYKEILDALLDKTENLEKYDASRKNF